MKQITVTRSKLNLEKKSCQRAQFQSLSGSCLFGIRLIANNGYYSGMTKTIIGKSSMEQKLNWC